MERYDYIKELEGRGYFYNWGNKTSKQIYNIYNRIISKEIEDSKPQDFIVGQVVTVTDSYNRGIITDKEFIKAYNATMYYVTFDGWAGVFFAEELREVIDKYGKKVTKEL